METLLLGLGVGLFAGLIPGAYSTVVATTALERGRSEGFKVSAIPALTETTVMLVAVLVLARLPEETLRSIGITGGILLLFMAWRVFRDARNQNGDPDAGVEELAEGDGWSHLLRVAAFGLLAPGAWAFWFLLGAPLVLNRWGVGPLHALLFHGAFLTAFVGALLALAWAVGSGRKFLNARWHRRILKGASGLLVVVGGVLIWQSWAGNFTDMVRTPDFVEEHQSSERSTPPFPPPLHG